MVSVALPIVRIKHSLADKETDRLTNTAFMNRVRVYMPVCACGCAYSEGEREREREGGRQTDSNLKWTALTNLHCMKTGLVEKKILSKK